MSINRAASRDPRVIRTRQWLRQALLASIEQHGFEKVTVSDIIERAGVNRTTFYKHYLDKWDLLQDWVSDVRLLLEHHALRPDVQTDDADLVPEVVVLIFEHIAEHAAFYRLMVGPHRLTLIADTLQHQVETFLVQHAEHLFAGSGHEAVPVGLLCRSYAAGFVGVVAWWLETGQQYSPRQIAAWVWQTS